MSRFYTEDHEWVTVDGDTITIGISSHAAEELGEIVYVEMPNTGDEIQKSDEFGSVESVKTVSGLYAPVSGTVIETNEAVVNSPELINQFPFEDGWLIKVKCEDLSEVEDLMNEESYNSFLSTLD